MSTDPVSHEAEDALERPPKGHAAGGVESLHGSGREEGAARAQVARNFSFEASDRAAIGEHAKRRMTQ